VSDLLRPTHALAMPAQAPIWPLSVPASWRRILVEIFSRGTATAATGYFAWNAAQQVMLNPSRISLLCVLLSESLTLFLILISRMPKSRDWHVLSVLAGIYVYIYSALLDTSPGVAIAPHGIAGAFGAFGFMLMIWAKLSLGRSFGILPGKRKLVFSGPYAFIRHPIYAGFLMVDLSYLLTDYNPQNAFVLSSMLACQLYRVVREERLLREDPAYVAYCEEVRHRFIPFVV